MTISEVAKAIGKSEQSVRRAIKSGKLKAIKVNGKYQIDESDINDSLKDSQKIVNDSQAIVTENEYLKKRVSELEAERERLQSQVEKAGEAMAEASQRHDTIVLQLTVALDQSQKLLEYRSTPWYRRIFQRKQKPRNRA